MRTGQFQVHCTHIGQSTVGQQIPYGLGERGFHTGPALGQNRKRFVVIVVVRLWFRFCYYLVVQNRRRDKDGSREYGQRITVGGGGCHFVFGMKVWIQLSWRDITHEWVATSLLGGEKEKLLMKPRIMDCSLLLPATRTRHHRMSQSVVRSWRWKIFRLSESREDELETIVNNNKKCILHVRHINEGWYRLWFQCSSMMRATAKAYCQYCS
jgi:hypothetical protein